MTPILIKKKSASAPESDSSDISYDITPTPKKKLSLDDSQMKDEILDCNSKNFSKEKSEKMQEKDLDETSYCSIASTAKTLSPVPTLTSVNS